MDIRESNRFSSSFCTYCKRIIFQSPFDNCKFILPLILVFISVFLLQFRICIQVEFTKGGLEQSQTRIHSLLKSYTTYKNNNIIAISHKILVQCSTISLCNIFFCYFFSELAKRFKKQPSSKKVSTKSLRSKINTRTGLSESSSMSNLFNDTTRLRLHNR